MPQIKFLSSDHHKEYEVEDSFWIEIEMDGKTWRVDIGKQPHSDRNSIHINGPVLEVNHHSINALDVYTAVPPPKVKP